MKKVTLALVVIVSAAAAAVVSVAQDDPVSSEMTVGARQFLSALQTYQKTPTMFDFEDEERFDFHYIPRERAGIALKDGVEKVHILNGFTRLSVLQALTNQPNSGTVVTTS